MKGHCGREGKKKTGGKGIQEQGDRNNLEGSTEYPKPIRRSAVYSTPWATFRLRSITGQARSKENSWDQVKGQ